MNVLDQFSIRERPRTAAALVDAIERAVRTGAVRPGDRLPTVRALAEASGASPATVAGAYGRLRPRGLVGGGRRRGTHLAPQPPLSAPASFAARDGARDLQSGNPDPKLL